jgi:hypothetical protein
MACTIPANANSLAIINNAITQWSGNTLGPVVPGGYTSAISNAPYLHAPVTLSDYDIELMALCIANKHPLIEGQSSCFCMLKRLAKGISKD